MNIGDKWVSALVLDGMEHTGTITITGEEVTTTWFADKVKLFEIKSIDHEDGDMSELTSYSLAGKD